MNTENAKQLISQFLHKNCKYLPLYLSFLTNESSYLHHWLSSRVLILYGTINEAAEPHIVTVTRTHSVHLQASLQLPALLHKSVVGGAKPS